MSDLFQRSWTCGNNPPDAEEGAPRATAAACRYSGVGSDRIRGHLKRSGCRIIVRAIQEGTCSGKSV